LRYLWVLFNTAVWTTVLGLSGILASFFEPRRGRTLGHCANLWGKIILFFSGVKYTIKGLENLDPDGSYIFAGNHASGFDILLGFAGLPYWVVSVSKIELKSIIILGWVMSTAGHIFVDRGRSDMALKSLEKAKLSLIKMPRSVLLFPEGTRTRDGSLGQFKRGGLMLSVDTGIPIVPVAFKGTFEMLEKGSWSMKNHPIEMRIGEPISPDSYSYATRRELANEVKTKVQELLSKA
tara:strand:- start:1916 stop:2623 length:708 start_codon:yes stop_codon:yes gene_type:complete